MPRASLWLIRAAFLYLCAGALLGAVMLAGKAVPGLAWTLALRPAHQDVMVGGWMLQLVFGVAFWIFPRLPERSRDEGTPRVAAAGLLLNLGVLTAVWGGLTAVPAAAATGRAAQLVATVLVASVLWPRVRRYGMIAEISGRAGR